MVEFWLVLGCASVENMLFMNSFSLRVFFLQNQSKCLNVGNKLTGIDYINDRNLKVLASMIVPIKR